MCPTTAKKLQLHHLDDTSPAERMLTRVMTWLTVAVTILTISNVALVAYAIFTTGTH